MLTLSGIHRDIEEAEVLLKHAFSSDDRADKENEPPKKSKLSLPASLLCLLPRLTTTALSLTEGHVDLEASLCR